VFWRENMNRVTKTATALPWGETKKDDAALFFCVAIPLEAPAFYSVCPGRTDGKMDIALVL
jgi:hypothetical protein